MIFETCAVQMMPWNTQNNFASQPTHKMQWRNTKEILMLAFRHQIHKIHSNTIRDKRMQVSPSSIMSCILVKDYS